MVIYVPAGQYDSAVRLYPNYEVRVQGVVYLEDYIVRQRTVSRDEQQSSVAA